MESQTRKNIGWIDMLRIAACFLVVFAHCCDPFVASFDTNRSNFLQGCALGSAVRCCVPLFVMMTGVLLFPIRGGMHEFYRKRLGRIAVPLVFWSLMLPVLYFIYLNYIGATDNPCLDMSTFSGRMTLVKMGTFIFNFNYDTTPLWYLYMLVGLYLVMPIFGTWLERASRKEVRLFLYVWGISLFLPYVKMAAPALGYIGNWGNMDILGVCDWNAFGSFYYVSGFIGYLILAHYLVKYPLQWSWKKLGAIGIPMFVVGYAITFGGYQIMQEHFPGNYAYLEIVWLFSGINVFMMTFPVFVCLQKSGVPSSAGLSRVASTTFGIYLCHFVFVQVAYDVFARLLPEETPAAIHILCMAVATFLVCHLLVRGMYACKWTKRLVA
ncbi:acyltransferase [Phocaeicola sp.]|uniref:acyltransferase n=1 Tax=Phocaeicola sp. TaxID=2773926 RepID=UPI0023C2E0C5|nr:acyltransferase [Phocaeicola sp.]MDE5677633.1 acyltransferase [Phocaeicola sp.]